MYIAIDIRVPGNGNTCSSYVAIPIQRNYIAKDSIYNNNVIISRNIFHGEKLLIVPVTASFPSFRLTIYQFVGLCVGGSKRKSVLYMP